MQRDALTSLERAGVAREHRRKHSSDVCVSMCFNDLEGRDMMQLRLQHRAQLHSCTLVSTPEMLRATSCATFSKWNSIAKKTRQVCLHLLVLGIFHREL